MSFLIRWNASAAGFLPSSAVGSGWDAAGGNGCSREPAGGGGTVCSHAPAAVDAEPGGCPGGDAGGGDVGCVQSYTLELVRCSADEADHTRDQPTDRPRTRERTIAPRGGDRARCGS